MYGKTSALLIGDSHKNKEREMIDLSPHADFLKIAHHGSNIPALRSSLLPYIRGLP